MSLSELQNIGKLYKKELEELVIPFWLEHSIDREDGGFYTCLLRDGQVFDTDKFIWLQARQVWTFAKMYNDLRAEPIFLETAQHGAIFLAKYGRDKAKNWYFSLNKEGRPLVKAYNIFSDCFACMAFGQLFKATGDEKHKQICLDTFHRILERKDNPKGVYNKQVPETRSLKNFALPMILANLSVEIEDLIDTNVLRRLRNDCMHTVLSEFYLPEVGLLLENINGDNSFSDTFDGRLLNPGHGLEALWFIMDLAEKDNNVPIIEKCSKIALNILDHSWDNEYGGIFYFMDVKGYPPQQLEWDQKLWWVHLESAITCIKAYLHTKEDIFLDWFQKIHSYQWSNFRDAEFGEWYGYLNREGRPLLQLKGGKWKGCFHVPRSLFIISQTIQNL